MNSRISLALAISLIALSSAQSAYAQFNSVSPAVSAPAGPGGFIGTGAPVFLNGVSSTAPNVGVGINGVAGAALVGNTITGTTGTGTNPAVPVVVTGTGFGNVYSPGEFGTLPTPSNQSFLNPSIRPSSFIGPMTVINNNPNARAIHTAVRHILVNGIPQVDSGAIITEYGPSTTHQFARVINHTVKQTNKTSKKKH